GDDLILATSSDADVHLPVDEHGETILCVREGGERWHVGGILAGDQTGQLTTQHPARRPLVSAPLDHIEDLLEHGALTRLPRRDHGYDAPVAGGDPIART